MAGIGEDAESKSTPGKFGAVAANGCLQPPAGGRVVVLRQNVVGPGKGGFTGGEVGAEKEEIPALHKARDTVKERGWFKIGQNAE